MGRPGISGNVHATASRDGGQDAFITPAPGRRPAPEAAGMTGEDPAVYEGAYVFWPWGRLVDAAVRWIEANAPHRATVLDYMCGTGFLLNKVRAARPDLQCYGCDIDPGFIAYGRDRYPGIDLSAGSALEYDPPGPAAVIVCTGGLHHLRRDKRPAFLVKCRDELAPAGTILIGEEVVGEFDGTASRRSAVLQLYSAILEHVIRADAPAEILCSAAGALRNELIEDGTSKDSRTGLMFLLEQALAIRALDHTWPGEPCQFGDYLAVCGSLQDRSPGLAVA